MFLFWTQKRITFYSKAEAISVHQPGKFIGRTRARVELPSTISGILDPISFHFRFSILHLPLLSIDQNTHKAFLLLGVEAIDITAIACDHIIVTIRDIDRPSSWLESRIKDDGFLKVQPFQFIDLPGGFWHTRKLLMFPVLLSLSFVAPMADLDPVRQIGPA